MSGGTILAIDPGPEKSGWVLVAARDYYPLRFGKDSNSILATQIECLPSYRLAVVEMVASYGMAVGKDVFDTCVWIGRFTELILGARRFEPVRVYRRDVKLHHCHQSKANDSNVRQALVDRFAPYTPNYGKGTKNDPGWFYGFSADVWQAYALAVYAIDQLREREAA